MIKYDADYYVNLLKIQTQTAKLVCDIRWEFIKKNIFKDWHKFVPAVDVLDYGCGIGFMKAFKPDWVNVMDTYDIMQVPQTGIRQSSYDIMLMYDVLEHVADFTELNNVLNATKYAVISLPIKPPNLSWDKYKHFKPGEHLHYFTHDLLEHLFKTMGLYVLAKGQPECPPRQHIWTYIFKK